MESTLIPTGVGGMIMAETKVRKTREGKPKSRNGCKTCKLRRVKCDETKPHCMRCTRFGQRCDGYIAKMPSKTSLQVTTTRTLAPRGPEFSPSLNARSEASSESPTATQSSALPTVSSAVFQSQQEYDAFIQFCRKSSLFLSTVEYEKWNSFVLQACESSPSIRYAVVSIGSLEEAALGYGALENGVGTLQPQSTSGRHRQSSCVLKRAFGGELYDFRTTLTGCLLFSCFDGFRPCRELPVERVLLGLRQLRDWASNAYGMGDRKEPLARPDVAETDDEIVRAFKSMEIQIMTHVDEKEMGFQEEYLRMGRAGSDSMPVMFENVEEAKCSLEQVIRRSMRWLRNLMRVQIFPSESLNSEMGQSAHLHGTDPRCDDTAAILQDYKRWDEAFLPLLKFARSKGSSEENFLRASLLRLHWLSGYLSISSNNSQPSIINNRRFTNELEELICISTLLLRKCQKGDEDHQNMHLESGPGAGSADSMFEFDMQIIVPIMTVGWICRHRALRQEAIELLSRSSRRDGAWDGVVIGKAMSWLAQIEEEGLTREELKERYLPESATARGIKISFDTERRVALVSCLQPVRGGELGEEHERRIEIPW